MKSKKILLLTTILILSLSLISCKRNISRAYKDFSSVSKEYCNIPGLDTKFVPQGITYNELHQVILVVGYNSDDTPSPIYVLDKNGKEIKKITFKLESGKDYTGHAGGIVSFNNIVFVSSGKKVYKIDINKILNADNNDCITVDKTTKVDLDGATMFVYKNYLFVTEFYYPKKYETEKSHYIQTSNGTNKALAFAYEIDEENISGLKSNIPQIALSIPDKVQGIVIKNNEIIFSTSYGRQNDSYIYKYKNIFLEGTHETYKYNDLTLPLYIIDKKDLIKSMLSPSMSEGVCLLENKLLILFESAAKKYRLLTKCEVYKIWESEF